MFVCGKHVSSPSVALFQMKLFRFLFWSVSLKCTKTKTRYVCIHDVIWVGGEWYVVHLQNVKFNALDAINSVQNQPKKNFINTFVSFVGFCIHIKEQPHSKSRSHHSSFPLSHILNEKESGYFSKSQLILIARKEHKKLSETKLRGQGSKWYRHKIILAHE